MTTEETLQAMQKDAEILRARMDKMGRTLEIGLIASLLGWALVIGYLFLRGSSPSIPSRIGLTQDKNETFITITDMKGTPRMFLGAGDGGTGITLLDAKGTPRMVLSVDDDEAKINLMDKKETPRVALFETEGIAGMAIADAKGTPRMVLRDEVAGIDILDEKGTMRLKLASGRESAYGVCLTQKVRIGSG
jgi:hypothetical protein